MRVRIGLADASHDVEVEVGDGDSFIKDIEAALEADKSMIWLDDSEGNKYGIAVSRITYVRLEGESERTVGFG
ncbi:MAG: DUF3107 family protein [Acidimicrobiia bacterium]|nr:DUF3107 family protein [Acidimicrobiia bacterium]